MTKTNTEAVEALGEALHNLSAVMLAEGMFENDDVHGSYERVVSAFKALSPTAKTEPSAAGLEGDTPSMQASRFAEMIAEVQVDGACVLGRSDLGDLKAAYTALSAPTRERESEDNLDQFRVVTLQVSKRDGASIAHSVTQHWGIYSTDEEAVGAAVAKLPELKPGFSVDQFLVCQPFNLLTEGSGQ